MNDRWEYATVNVAPGESRYDALRKFGAEGWEAWYIDRNADGWCELYFKRRIHGG